MRKAQHFIVPLLLWIIIIPLAFFLTRSSSRKSEEKAITQPKTELIEYTQKSVPSESHEGTCWSESIAAYTNTKAWRCYSGDFIYDPCFETDVGRVVCGVDPEDEKSGFELKLTKPLPERGNFSDRTKRIWRLKLSNGLICRPFMGTAGLVDGEYYYYNCGNEKTVIFGDLELHQHIDKTMPLWKVTVSYLSDDYSKIIKNEVLDILKMWE